MIHQLAVKCTVTLQKLTVLHRLRNHKITLFMLCHTFTCTLCSNSSL